jgi:phosphatidylglycerophosphatase C
MAAVQLAVFDLDGTLTWHDTMAPFLMGYLVRHPARVRKLWRLPLLLAEYLLAGRDRGRLKAQVIQMVMGGERRARIDAWADAFAGGRAAGNAFRPQALTMLETHRKAGDRLVLLSASPDLYVPRIGRLLGFDETICTEVRWRADRLDGSLVTPNRRGEEKRLCVRQLRERFPTLPVAAYGNSASDLAHLAEVEHPLLVNGNAAAKRRAVQLGIPVADWR